MAENELPSLWSHISEGQFDAWRAQRKSSPLVGSVLGAGATAGLGSVGRVAMAQGTLFAHPFAHGPRSLVEFPEKRPLIVPTSRPPQLKTLFEVFNEGLGAPNELSSSTAATPESRLSIDADKHVTKVGGNAAGKPFQLTLAELKAQFKPVEIVAVNR